MMRKIVRFSIIELNKDQHFRIKSISQAIDRPEGCGNSKNKFRHCRGLAIDHRQKCFPFEFVFYTIKPDDASILQKHTFRPNSIHFNYIILVEKWNGHILGNIVIFL